MARAIWNPYLLEVWILTYWKYDRKVDLWEDRPHGHHAALRLNGGRVRRKECWKGQKKRVNI